MKVPIFLEAEIILNPQFNIEKKDDDSILTNDFSSRTNPSIVLELLDRSGSLLRVFENPNNGEKIPKIVILVTWK